MRTFVPVYRVVDRHGATVREYVEGRSSSSASRTEAVRHAAKLGGRVFRVDEQGYLELVFGARSRVA